MAAIEAVVATAILTGLNVIQALVKAQQEVNAGKRQYTPEELALVDQLNAQSESGWADTVSAAKARLGIQPSPTPQSPAASPNASGIEPEDAPTE